MLTLRPAGTGATVSGSVQTDASASSRAAAPHIRRELRPWELASKPINPAPALISSRASPPFGYSVRQGRPPLLPYSRCGSWDRNRCNRENVSRSRPRPSRPPPAPPGSLSACLLHSFYPLKWLPALVPACWDTLVRVPPISTFAPAPFPSRFSGREPLQPWENIPVAASGPSDRCQPTQNRFPLASSPSSTIYNGFWLQFQPAGTPSRELRPFSPLRSPPICPDGLAWQGTGILVPGASPVVFFAHTMILNKQMSCSYH
jgi:hypothetical protein